MHEYGPGAVVDAPVVVDRNAVAQRFLHGFRELGAAVHRIVDLVELMGEPVHVVDLARVRSALHEGARRVPMSRYGENGARGAAFFDDARSQLC